MPSYDFRCLDCKHRMVLTFSYAEYATAEKRCLRCNSLNITRVMTKVAVAKGSARFANLEDDSALDDLAEADPTTLGHFMRRMADESGEDLGEEFNTIVERLERGEDPESIEASMMDADEGFAADVESDSEAEAAPEAVGAFEDSSTSFEADSSPAAASSDE